MSFDRKMLVMAAATAVQGSDISLDIRSYRLGAVGLRADDVIVASRNLPAQDCIPEHHAETRLVRKLTRGSVVWVARIGRTGAWRMARPCKGCENCLRASGIKRIVYTVSPGEWESIIL